MSSPKVEHFIETGVLFPRIQRFHVKQNTGLDMRLPHLHHLPSFALKHRLRCHKLVQNVSS